ncbi:MAG TPA: response regulator transcription factor [Candidatus Stercorousia faecigallinarum]|nr:response regulator transcription factor [Candidatus Stercorousia faecigallinarum]
MNKGTVLVIEDDKMIQNLMSTTLEISNYTYQIAPNAEQGILKAASYNPDVIILDLGLPDMDGIEVIKKVRSFSNIPIIVVSARIDNEDKISALDAGADDYLTKPFNTEELLARIRVALRRKTYTSEETVQTSVFTNGNLKIDYAQGCVYVDDKEVHLTAIEYKLLCLLAKNLGKVLTHNYIKKEIWLDDNGCDSQLSLRVFVTNLRKKLNASDYIKTHIGIGYRMLQQGKN